MHGTNSILQFEPDGRVDCPRIAPIFMETLGSQFLSHPPIEPYTVKLPIMIIIWLKALKPFETTDELYLMENSWRTPCFIGN